MTKKYLLSLVLISLLQIILITGQVLGLNVILFMIPFLLFIIFFLKDNNLINNKKGLLLLIPIIILSLSYLIYDNILNYLNILVIPILTIFMLIEVINQTDNLECLIEKFFFMIFKPFDYLSIHVNNTRDILKNTNIKKNKLKRIKSYLIVIPIIIIVLVLLSSADIVFASFFKDINNIFKDIKVEGIITRIFQFFILFLYLGATLMYLLKEKIEVGKISKGIKVEEFTIKLLLFSLNIIYVVFIFIQIFSLGLHKLPKGITYSEYARTGFFQLMIISIINIVIILISKSTKENKLIKGMNLLMVLLTFMIIYSSFYRMHLYEITYGYTLLRLGVYFILLTEVILLIPTIIYIVKDNFKVLKYYLIIPIIIYSMINLISIEKIITNRNISLYNKKHKIDIEYLENNYGDNIEELIDFYHTVGDKEIKKSLSVYFKNYNPEMDNILEFNISKYKAKKLIKEELK